MASSPANLWVLLGLGVAGVLLLAQKWRKAVREDFGAFVARLSLLPPPPPPPPKAPHPLAGLSFAVADLFDVEGSVTGFGNPDWAKTHQPALETALAVSAVVEGGASCVGKTVIDEMGVGIQGGSKHFEAPTNPATPAKISGGSCSGSAVAVAASIVDFSLGLDTTGGIRIPAACCGILGFRPTHGAISRAGVLPVSPSLDVVGWFAKDPIVLKSVGQVLLKLPYTADDVRPRQVIFADDCFQLLRVPKSRVAQVVLKSVEKLFGRQVVRNAVLQDYLSSKVPSLKYFADRIKNGESNSSLRQLAYAMQSLQRREFKVNHHEWVTSAKPELDSTTSGMMQSQSDPVDETLSNCQAVRSEMQSALNTLLKNDGVLVIPTLIDLPPKLGSREVCSEEYRIRVYSLSAIASMSGCCEVTLPLGQHNKSLVSVSFIARQGGDSFLLDLAKSIFITLQQDTEIDSKPDMTADTMGKEMAAETAKEKGNIAYREKQWQKAVGFYTEAIKFNGKVATYYSNRAAAYLEMDSFLQAEADCTTAINLDKKNVKAYLRRATAREMLSYYNEAMKDFKYALVLEPTNKTASSALNRMKKLFQ